MPNLDSIPEVLYRPEDPYHWQFDNLPLKNLLRRQNLINLALDNVVAQTQDAIGTQGTVANRLNQSIEQDGSLKTVAIDDALHDIGAHTDSDEYVRMTKEQSDKLDLIADDATNFSVEIDRDGNEVTFDTGVLRFMDSDSVTFEVTASNQLRANLAFPLAAAHVHYRDQNPVHSNITTPDYTNYKVNSSSTAFVSGSLLVFINGLRLTSSAEIYVPGALVNDPWTLMTFTPNPSSGTFELSAALSSEDIIRIDYDISYI